MPQQPRLSLHHVNIPVTDLDASVAWYTLVLGYTVERNFLEDGAVVGTALRPRGNGLRIALRLASGGSIVSSYPSLLAFAVPGRAELEDLVAHLEEMNITHAPLRDATTGSLLELTDPDGWVVRIYTVPED